MSSQIAASVHEVLNNREIPEVPGTHECRNSGIVGRIHVGSKLHEQLDDFEPFGVGFSSAIAVDPRISRGLHQRCFVVAGHNVGVGTVRQQ